MRSLHACHSLCHLQAVVFHCGREGASLERTIEFKETLLHIMSLMHALALQHLRGDWDLHNLQPAHPTDLPPPVVRPPPSEGIRGGPWNTIWMMRA